MTPNSFAVCEFYKDGKVFPVSIGESESQAKRGLYWMQQGRGQFEDWRMIPMSELKDLLSRDLVCLECFTKEAQEEKRKIINAS